MKEKEFYYLMGGRVCVFSWELDGRYSLGATYEDSERGLYVRLSDAQVRYMMDHPSASMYEVWAMREREPYVPTLEDLRAMRIAELEEYDRSKAVNNFKLNGMDVWLDRETRMSLRDSIGIELRSGRHETTVWLGRESFTFDCKIALGMLDALELYAIACYNKTAEHWARLMSMEKEEDIRDYDFTRGYPEQLVFND